MIFVPKEIVYGLTPMSYSPLFFLAGPIRGGGDWQAGAAQQIIDHNEHAHIACPSRWTSAHPLAGHFYKPFSPAENRQLLWERHYLERAGLAKNVPGCVLFWLGLESKTEPHPGPEPYAMDTRREIGKFTAYAEMRTVRMVVGGHQDFYGLNVILFELEKAFGRKIVFHQHMVDLVDAAFAIASEH
jgi:hypothetical protein